MEQAQEKTAISSKNRVKVKDMTLISLFIVLAIVGSKLAIPVFSIPFTLQVLVCLLTGALLGAGKALVAQGIFIFMGLLGLPVFALGGGPAYVLQPSFGYLPGMLLAAGAVGFLYDKPKGPEGKSKVPLYFLINLFGLVIIYSVGVSYLYLIRHFYIGGSITFIRAIQLGMLPYLVTDGLYCFLAAIMAPVLRRAIRR